MRLISLLMNRLDEEIDQLTDKAIDKFVGEAAKEILPRRKDPTFKVKLADDAEEMIRFMSNKKFAHPKLKPESRKELERQIEKALWLDLEDLEDTGMCVI